MEEILEVLQEEFRAAIALRSTFPRTFVIPPSNYIKVIVGIRRSGKTALLFQVAQEAIAKGVPIERILYLNFEDDRLLPFVQSMRPLIDAWYALYPGNLEERCYLLLDGVEKVEVWPLVLRKLHDTKNVEIFITGSSGNLLEREIASTLKDRSSLYEVLPYSYQEYLAFHDFSPVTKKGIEQQRQTFAAFLQKGGLPGIQKLDTDEHLATLQSYLDRVIFRDMVERHQISNVSLLKYFIYFLFKSTTHPFSINKFYFDIKSQGYKVAKDTLHAYLAYLEEAHLIFTVPIFSDSLRKKETVPKKIYSGDTGLIVANLFNQSRNFSKLFENQLYLDLRREGKRAFYYQTSNGQEVDFITQDSDGQHEILQVVWDFNDEALLDRKTRALERAKKELGFPGKVLDFRLYLEELVEKQV